MKQLTLRPSSLSLAPRHMVARHQQKANQRPAVRQANLGKAFLKLDCNDTAFDLDFQGNVAQQALPNIDYGTSTERYDVLEGT